MLNLRDVFKTYSTWEFWSPSSSKILFFDTYCKCLISVFLVSVISHGELCECVCVSVCLCLGLKVVAAGWVQKQRTTTLHSCSNSNWSLTGTLCKTKESISIPANTMQICNLKISHTHTHTDQRFYVAEQVHPEQRADAPTSKSQFDWWRTVALWHIASLRITPQTIISESETSHDMFFMSCL